MIRSFALALIFGAGCITETNTEVESCSLTLTPPEDVVVVGEPVTVYGRPFTALFDSSIRFEQTDATLVDVSRDDCALCDTCRDQAECSDCEACEVCATSCETCVESMTLTVPDLPTGDYYVTARNSYGLSAPTEWSVENPNDDENTEP